MRWVLAMSSSGLASRTTKSALLPTATLPRSSSFNSRAPLVEATITRWLAGAGHRRQLVVFGPAVLLGMPVSPPSTIVTPAAPSRARLCAMRS
jgi:hypothetical protein